ncbi:MAG: ComEC/Rec2 family competence protein [Flavobacteriales bacterium]|nr:ComEC/Rec2 family competence protein [Flavobacteriales bacterium]
MKKDLSSLNLQVDDELWMSSGLTAIAGQKNPEEFDYANYQSHHHIYLQSYADSSQWKFSKRPKHHSSLACSSCREYLLDILKSNDIEEREYAVLSALVLGKSTGIDAELMSAYAGVGAVHVLAVSGLHVALIYVLLAPLMKKLLHSNKWRLIKTIIPTILLWTYAGITGFSPSVLRAALMFSFFIIADNYQKQNNIYNTMSASALVLLLYNPMMLLELGFQLSYLAVLGIVVLQQKIASLFYPGNKLLIWAWKLTAVSIAAQIATFPITIYYFHQFPNYFLLSNFLVIPLSTLILYVSLSFFAFSWIPVAGNFLAHLSAFLTRVMNDLMIWMNELPESVTNGISISLPEAICISGMIVFFTTWLFWKRSGAILPALALTLILAFAQVNEKLHIGHQENLFSQHARWLVHLGNLFRSGFYDRPGETVMDDRSRKFHLQSYWDKMGVEEVDFLAIDSLKRFSNKYCRLDYPLMQIGDTKILFVDATSIQQMSEIEFDFCLIDGADRKLFFNDSTMKYFEGKTILLGEKVRTGMKQYLWKHLSENAHIFNLGDGAVICRNGMTAHFSLWR